MTRLRRLLRILLWSVLTLTGVLVLGYLVLVLINLHDQPPSAKVLAWQQQFDARPAVADKDNGFVYMLGFAVHKSGDPVAEGSRHMNLIRRLNADPYFKPASFPDYPSLGLRSKRCCEIEKLSSACNMPEADCLLALAKNLRPLRQWVSEEKWLLERYRTLLALPGWQEPIPMDLLAPWPPYSDVTEGQKLLLAQALLLANDGNVGAARGLLEEDAHFWRRVVADSEYLIVKVVAASALRRHLLWTSLIARRLPPAQMNNVIAGQWQQPISHEELSMQRVLAGEWTFADKFIRDIDRRSPRVRTDEEFSNWLDTLLYTVGLPLLQPQDASNHHAEILGNLADALDQMVFTDVVAGHTRARDIEDRTRLKYSGLQPYNLTNSIMLSFIGPIHYEYWSRTADLEGARRAMLLTIQLRSESVPSSRVRAALQQSALRNPYSQGAFEWDENAGGIVFTGMTEGERGRVLFVY